MKTIKIDHPTSDEIMKLEDLRETCFRIGEHITKYWESFDLCITNLNEKDKYVLSNNCSRSIEYLEAVAWRIDKLLKYFGDLPF